MGKIKKQEKETICHWLEDRLVVRDGNHNNFNFYSEGLGQWFRQEHKRMSNSADTRTLKVHLLFLWKRKRGNWGEAAKLSCFFSSSQTCRREVLSSHRWVCFGKAQPPNVLRDWFSPRRHRFSFSLGQLPSSHIWAVLFPPAKPSSFKDATENLQCSLAGSNRAPSSQTPLHCWIPHHCRTARWNTNP